MANNENGVFRPSVLDEALMLSKQLEYSKERAKNLDTQQIINDFGKSRFYFYLTMKPEFRRFAVIRNYTKHDCWRFLFYSQKYSVTTGYTTISPTKYLALRNVSPAPPVNFSNGKKDFIINDGLEQPCLMCRGKKYTNCEYCSGRGIVTCSDCNGNKYIFETLESAENAPHINNGTNNLHPAMVKCETCNGKGNVQCSRCRGRGKQVCDICDGSGVTYSVEQHRMEYWVEKKTNNLYGDIPRDIADKFIGKKEIERYFNEPEPPLQKGISTCQLEGFSIPILLLEVYFEGKDYTIFYDLHSKKYQWTGYPVDYKRILAVFSIFISILFAITYLLANGRIFG